MWNKPELTSKTAGTKHGQLCRQYITYAMMPVSGSIISSPH